MPPYKYIIFCTVNTEKMIVCTDNFLYIANDPQNEPTQLPHNENHMFNDTTCKM